MKEKRSIYELWKELQAYSEHATDLFEDTHLSESKRVLEENIKPLRSELMEKFGVIDCLGGDTFVLGFEEVTNIITNETNQAISIFEKS